MTPSIALPADSRIPSTKGRVCLLRGNHSGQKSTMAASAVDIMFLGER